MQTNAESTLRIRVHFAHFNRNSLNFRIFVLIPEYAFIMGRRFTTDLVGIYRYLWDSHSISYSVRAILRGASSQEIWRICTLYVRHLAGCSVPSTCLYSVHMTSVRVCSRPAFCSPSREGRGSCSDFLWRWNSPICARRAFALHSCSELPTRMVLRGRKDGCSRNVVF